MKKILLIEDDQIMRENTQEILELSNFKVESAENGKLGVKKAKEYAPDLIISDIMMPELDGYGVLHMLSRDPATSSIPFIFLTAKAEKSDVRRGMELGADDYLTKPFEEMDLLNAIDARLKRHQKVNDTFTQDGSGIESFLERASEIINNPELADKKTVAKYKKKQIIFHEADMPQYLYFIETGKVKVFKTHDDGKEYVTNVFKDGEFFGIPPLIEGGKYTDSAVVLEDSEICKIPKDDFLSLLYKNRDVSSQFIKLLSNYVEEREKQLLSFAYDTVRKRAAETLIALEKRYRSDNPDDTIIRITRDDLASMAGTATETMIRCLSEFKSDGLIEINRREIVILDREALANIRY